MDPLASISSAAAGMAAANLARLGVAASAAGQDPGPATAVGLAGSGTAAEASVAVLKKVINLEAASGAQLAQLIVGQVDLQA
jgi:hypothetical protein